jgi:hypothetical protein
MGNTFNKTQKKNGNSIEKKISVINLIKDVKIETDSNSSETINKIVDQLISKKDVNMSYVPDVVEKEIYKNLIIYFFGIFKEVVDSTKIEFLDHEITFIIKQKYV